MLLQKRIPIVFIIVVYLTFAIFTIVFPYWFSNYIPFHEIQSSIGFFGASIIFGLFAFCIILPIITLAILIRTAFNHTLTRAKSLGFVFITYLYMIFAFACVYFLMCDVGDHVNAVRMKDAPSYESGLEQEMPVKNKGFVDLSPFQGIDKKLWRSVDTPDKKVCQLTENKNDVFIDCLYLSTVTIATLGYGDIVPKLWYSKLGISIEVVIGQLFLVLGVSSAYSRKK
ncbi:MAG TPA: ion channel [Patescibacteria group bacterium]|nr:ion channel [Patescibacteria group bacterium]